MLFLGAASIAMLWLGLVWLVLPAPIASAHAYLLASTPPDGYALPTSPAALTLDFDEPVTIGAAALGLTDLSNGTHPLGSPTLTLEGRRLSTAVPEHLPDGGYRAHWQVTADDGDLVSGTISFAVGASPVTSAGAVSGSAFDSPLVVVSRWIVVTGLALALGGIVADRLAHSVARETDPVTTVRPPHPPRPAVSGGAGIGAVAAVVLAVDQVGADPARLIRTVPGLILLVEMIGFALAGLLAVVLARRVDPAPSSSTTGLTHPARPGELARTAPVVPLLAVVLAEGWRAHPHTQSPVWGTALTITHLIAVSVWVGGLVHVLRVARSWRAERGLTRLLVFDYSRLALGLAAVIVVTGTLEAVVVLPELSSLITTTYGLVLVAKLAVVVLVLGLAATGRRRLRRSTTTPTIPAPGRAVQGEVVALFTVLAVTALLVSTAPPAPVTTSLAAPPPPIGPVVAAGTLAGYTTVIATASEGQLLIRMTAPGRDDLGTDNATPEHASTQTPPGYQLTTLLLTPDAGSATVVLHGCGPGCFTAQVHWGAGTNHLHLSVLAPPWPPATAMLSIPWPPHPDSTLLPTMLTTMAAITTMTVHQAVTSNYTGDPGTDVPIHISAADYLASEPYAHGGGHPVVVPSGSGISELRLAFPQGIAIRLFLGPDDRILREEETTPNHLVTSTFEYPPTPR